MDLSEKKSTESIMRATAYELIIYLIYLIRFSSNPEITPFDIKSQEARIKKKKKNYFTFFKSAVPSEYA